MQPSLPVYCSPTEQRANFTTDPRHVSCASASVTTSRQLTDLGHSTDHAGYQPRRLDCAGNGSDVTSSRGRPSSASSSSQSLDDVSVPRSSLNSDVTTTYVDRTTAEFDAPVSDVTSAHNGYGIRTYRAHWVFSVLGSRSWNMLRSKRRAGAKILASEL